MYSVKTLEDWAKNRESLEMLAGTSDLLDRAESQEVLSKLAQTNKVRVPSLQSVVKALCNMMQDMGDLRSLQELLHSTVESIQSDLRVSSTVLSVRDILEEMKKSVWISSPLVLTPVQGNSDTRRRN